MRFFHIYSLLCVALATSQCVNKHTTLKQYYDTEIPAGRVLELDSQATSDASIRHLKFESLTWREGEVHPSKWHHHLKVFVPKQVRKQTAFLYISNGHLDEPLNAPIDHLVEHVASRNHCIGIELRLVPNQGLKFFDEQKPRFEDDLVAYSWRQYLSTGDRTWLAQYPMTKSVGQVMDFLSRSKSELADIDVDSFIVAGQSKRGWTAWLAAALDKRVKGVIPMVIDLVNIEPSMSHHFNVYGGWSWPLKDYKAHGITELLGKSEFEPIQSQIDPFRYRHNLTMPKLIINAANDQFFLPDSSKFYFDKLEGKKYLNYIPNAGHHIPATEYTPSVSVFVKSILDDKTLPQLSWSEDDDRLVVRSTIPPTKAVLWVAENAKARDFRLAESSPRYSGKTLKPLPDGTFAAKIDAPKQGWKAYFIALEYEIFGEKLILSTPVYMKSASLPSTALRQDPSEAVTAARM